MTLSTTKKTDFTRCKHRKVQANFGGGEISSDGGAMLINCADKIINLTNRFASTVNDAQDQEKIKHTILDTIRERIHGLALGLKAWTIMIL